VPDDLLAAIPYVEVAQYLADQGFPGAEWTLVRGRMPSQPDQVLAVFPAGGASPEGKYDLRYPLIQLRARGKKDEQTPAYLKLEAAAALLRGTRAQQMGAGHYVHFVQQGDVLPLGPDQNGRHEYTVNFRAAREPAA
jgi:hypothetical protein